MILFDYLWVIAKLALLPLWVVGWVMGFAWNEFLAGFEKGDEQSGGGF